MKCPECGDKLKVYRTYHRSETVTRHYARCGGCGRRFITETTLLGPVGRRKRPAPASGSAPLDYGRVLDSLRMQMTRQTFDNWVRPTRLHFYNGNGRVVIATGNRFALDWLQNRLADLFQRTVSAEVGHQVNVEFILED